MDVEKHHTQNDGHTLLDIPTYCHGQCSHKLVCGEGGYVQTESQNSVPQEDYEYANNGIPYLIHGVARDLVDFCEHPRDFARPYTVDE